MGPFVQILNNFAISLCLAIYEDQGHWLDSLVEGNEPTNISMDCASVIKLSFNCHVHLQCTI
ncbi:hypothetical protein KC19_10G050000 [Ceratodon purpureus]|uniref:Uncharacterized protein n=1 Tax=Ceratodon purpureus TaxID=3225 RepID=A0A8T0GJL7_CERPU|nr:hypothetical protein KC19_10G050000 [Ceratodon purpureus]